jgi:hypothetical protein
MLVLFQMNKTFNLIVSHSASRLPTVLDCNNDHLTSSLTIEDNRREGIRSQITQATVT